MSDWIFDSVRACVAALERREVSAVELVEAAWRRIDQVNPALNALVARREEGSRRDAEQADRLRARGEPRGPLCGVPMTLKDSLDTADLVSTWGTAGRSRFVPSADATVAARLRAAGAILLGKTNTPELTLGFHTSNALFGDTRNPYAVDHSPGGSSGGAAALVAAGGSWFDVGSDTGGSIRLPAHYCGIAGLRPTSGRVPRTGHAIDASGPIESLTQLGPLARHVGDLALLLEVLAGPDGEDPCVAPVPLRSPPDDLAGLRVAFHTDNGLAPAEASVAAVVRRAVEVLDGAGMGIAEARPGGIEATAELFPRLLMYDGGAWLMRLLAREGTSLEETSLARLMRVPAPPPEVISQTFERWTRYRQEMLQFWSAHDALVCPVHAGVAPRIGAGEGHLLAYAYTIAYNLTGCPAAVVRAGTSPEGLPIGVQIVAAPWREDVCLALAARIETELGGFVPPPPLVASPAGSPRDG